MAEWFEDEAFWRDTGPYMFKEARLEGTAAEVTSIIDLLEVEPPARILDLPCGPGRHTLELVRRGFCATGVDRTREYLDAARRRAAEEGLTVDLLQADMRDFRTDRPFHAVINMYSSFGYFRDPADDLRVARNLLAALEPGGSLLIEGMGKEVLARIFQPRRWEREEDGSIFLQETEVRKDWGWLVSTWTIIQGGRQVSHTLEHRVYSAVEFKTLLTEAGFRSVECFGSLEAAPYDHAAQRLVVRAVRPPS